MESSELENSVNLPECVAHLEKDRDEWTLTHTGARAQGGGDGDVVVGLREEGSTTVKRGWGHFKE